jgi:hypothetical protein
LRDRGQVPLARGRAKPADSLLRRARAVATIGQGELRADLSAGGALPKIVEPCDGISP